jgi:cysteinyl-tRNA synthetase
MWKQPVTVEKPKSEADRHRQALIAANVFIQDQKQKIRKPLDQYHYVANNQYWSYGYMGGTMLAGMALCLTAGNRVPFLRNYASWISLAVGYFGGRQLHQLHNSFNCMRVVKVIDENIAELQRMDEETKGSIPDYAREVQSLKKMKFDLAPQLPEAVEARLLESKQSAASLDDRVEELVAAFKRKHGTS